MTESMYKSRKFYEIRGEIWESRGMKDLVETGGNWAERTKIGGISNSWSITKKGRQKFGG